MEECKCKPAKSYAERIIEYKEFISLVKKMREAQKEFESDSPHMDYDKIMEVYHDKFRFESKVDEYLMKINN